MGITESISNGRSHAMENYVDFNGVSKRNASGQDTQKNMTYIITALGLVAVFLLFYKKY
jgi:exopolysaccharide biosynthesis protein